MAVQHVLGGLDESDGRLFRAHLLDCAHCRARVGELRAIAHELADVERDEARARDAKRLETKRREDGPDEPAAPPAAAGARSVKMALVLLLVALMGMGAWTFFLRTEVSDLQGQLAASREASMTLQNGRAWEVEAAEGLDAEVREDGGALVVVVDGLADADYSLEMSDAARRSVERQPARPTDGRLFVLLQELEPDTEELRLVPTDGQSSEPLVEASAGE